MLSIKNSFFIACLFLQTSTLLISAQQHPSYDIDAMEKEQKKRTGQLRATMHKFMTNFSKTHQCAQALITARTHERCLLQDAVRKKNPEVLRSQVAAVIRNMQKTERNLRLINPRKKFRVRVMDSSRRPVCISTGFQLAQDSKHYRVLYYYDTRKTRSTN